MYGVMIFGAFVCLSNNHPFYKQVQVMSQSVKMTSNEGFLRKGLLKTGLVEYGHLVPYYS